MISADPDVSFCVTPEDCTKTFKFGPRFGLFLQNGNLAFWSIKLGFYLVHFPLPSLCPRGRSDRFYNLVKNQSRRLAKKFKCNSTSKRIRAHKSRQKTPRLHIATIETCSFRPRGQNDCNGKRP